MTPPAAENEAGLVTATYRRHYDIALDDGEHVACVLKGRSLQIAVGDRVEIQRTDDGGPAGWRLKEATS